MATCAKCKSKIGMFDTSHNCMDDNCNKVFCTKCADTELVDCEYCSNAYCKGCLKGHTMECKAENEDEEDETCDECGELIDECTCGEIDGVTFSDDKTICILDIDNYNLEQYINVLNRLLKDFELNTVLSNDKSLVWVKRV